MLETVLHRESLGDRGKNIIHALDCGLAFPLFAAYDETG